MPQLRAGGRVRGAAVLEVRCDARLPLPVAADGVRTVADAHSGRPWLVSVRSLGEGLQLDDCRRLRIRPQLRRQLRARGTRAGRYRGDVRTRLDAKGAAPVYLRA